MRNTTTDFCNACLSGDYGSSCTPCSTPANATCLDGYYGSGGFVCNSGYRLNTYTNNTCTPINCTAPFARDAQDGCTACLPGYYGSSCTVCPTPPADATCNDGSTGNGGFTCITGYRVNTVTPTQCTPTTCNTPYARNTTTDTCQACLSSTVYGPNCNQTCNPGDVWRLEACDYGYYGSGLGCAPYTHLYAPNTCVSSIPVTLFNHSHGPNVTATYAPRTNLFVSFASHLTTTVNALWVAVPNDTTITQYIFYQRVNGVTVASTVVTMAATIKAADGWTRMALPSPMSISPSVGYTYEFLLTLSTSIADDRGPDDYANAVLSPDLSYYTSSSELLYVDPELGANSTLVPTCPLNTYGPNCLPCPYLDPMQHAVCNSGYFGNGSIACMNNVLVNQTDPTYGWVCNCPPQSTGVGPYCNHTCPNCDFTTAYCAGGVTATTGNCTCKPGLIRPMAVMSCQCPNSTYGAACQYNCPTCGPNQHCDAGYNATGACLCDAGFTLNNTTGLCDCTNARAYGPGCAHTCPVTLPLNTNCSAGVNGTGVICRASYLSFQSDGSCNCNDTTSFGSTCSVYCAPQTVRSHCVSGTGGTGTTCNDPITFKQEQPNNGSCPCAIPGDYGSTCQYSCACIAGQVCFDGVSGTGCVNAPPGYYANSTLGKFVACPPGTAQSQSGQTSCQACAFGTYAVGPAASICSSCAAGQYAPNVTSSTCVVANCSTLPLSQCALLPHACYVDTGLCKYGVDCRQLSHTDCVASATCSATSGTQCSFSTADCTPYGADLCNSTLYLSTGATCDSRGGVCVNPCLAPHWGPQCQYNCTGDPLRSRCSSGYAGTGDVCIGNTQTNPPLCSCVAGAYGASCNQTCSCVDGQWCSDGIAGTGCQNCTAGTAGTGGVCSPCAMGTFAPRAGTAACSICPDGQTTGGASSTGCIPCPPGARGSHSNNGLCVTCSAGTFSANYGSTQCYNCVNGTYAVGLGNVACSSCHVVDAIALDPTSSTCTCRFNHSIYTVDGCYCEPGRWGDACENECDCDASLCNGASGCFNLISPPSDEPLPNRTLPLPRPFWKAPNATEAEATLPPPPVGVPNATTAAITFNLDLSQVTDVEAFVAQFLAELALLTGDNGTSVPMQVNDVSPGSIVVNVTLGLTSAQILQQFASLYGTGSTTIDPSLYPLFVHTQTITVYTYTSCYGTRPRTALMQPIQANQFIVADGFLRPVNIVVMGTDGYGTNVTYNTTRDSILFSPMQTYVYVQAPAYNGAPYSFTTLSTNTPTEIRQGAFYSAGSFFSGPAGSGIELAQAGLYFTFNETVYYPICPGTVATATTIGTTASVQFRTVYDRTCGSYGTNCRSLTPDLSTYVPPVCYNGTCGCHPQADGTCDVLSIPTETIDPAQVVCVAGTAVGLAFDVCEHVNSTANRLAYVDTTRTAVLGMGTITTHAYNITETFNGTTAVVTVPSYNLTHMLTVTGYTSVSLIAQQDECQRRHPSYVNLFPRRRFCQHRNYAFGVDQTVLAGVLGDPFHNAPPPTVVTLQMPVPDAVALTINAGVVVRQLGYASNLYNGHAPLENKAWALIEYDALYDNRTVALSRLTLLDSVEGGPNWYFHNDTWNSFPCGPAEYADWDDSTNGPACFCRAFYARDPATGACVEGCTGGTTGFWCDQPVSATSTCSVAYDPATTALVNYACNVVVCIPPYRSVNGVCTFVADYTLLPTPSSSSSSSTLLPPWQIAVVSLASAALAGVATFLSVRLVRLRRLPNKHTRF